MAGLWKTPARSMREQVEGVVSWAAEQLETPSELSVSEAVRECIGDPRQMRACLHILAANVVLELEAALISVLCTNQRCRHLLGLAALWDQESEQFCICLAGNPPDYWPCLAYLARLKKAPTSEC
ncbi:MAG: hypothetical protein HY706_15030 [Candidatus Hydrogenedentes bacterium]|nr:hypothetical protein [Candidatus Hydrogenedentota bacterium]